MKILLGLFIGMGYLMAACVLVGIPAWVVAGILGP